MEAILSSYKKVLPALLWLNWNKRTLDGVLPYKSWISGGKCHDMCQKLVYKDMEGPDRVCTRLDKGADILVVLAGQDFLQQL